MISDIKEEVEKSIGVLGIKQSLDNQKKQLLISHSAADAVLADLIYKFCIFNNIPADRIIYTSSTDEVSRIPEGPRGENGIYAYLEKFFVQSSSDVMPFVIFVTSSKMGWGATVEVGASWITKFDHKIFNIYDLNTEEAYRPGMPLDIAGTYHSSEINYDQNEIYMDKTNLDLFCCKVEYVVKALKYTPKSRAENMQFLENEVH